MLLLVYGSCEADVERVSRLLSQCVRDVSRIHLSEGAKAALESLGGATSSQFVLEGCVLCIVSGAPLKSLLQLAVHSVRRAGVSGAMLFHATAVVREREALSDFVDAMCAGRVPERSVVLCGGVGCSPDRVQAPLSLGSVCLVGCERSGVEFFDGFALSCGGSVAEFIVRSEESMEVAKRSAVCHFSESIAGLSVYCCVPFVVDSAFLSEDEQHVRRRRDAERLFSAHAEGSVSVVARACLGRSVSGYPRVCVVISTFNRWNRLLEAVQSVCWQTLPVHHIVIVDDASTDGRYSLLQSMAESMASNGEKIHVVRRRENTKSELGFACPAVVRNEGMVAARAHGCDLVAVLDDDDIWMPDKMETQLRAMREACAPASCTEALYSSGRWAQQTSPDAWIALQTSLPKYNKVHFRRNVSKICQPYLDSRDRAAQAVVPTFIPEELLLKKNLVVHSSFVCHESIFPAYEKIQYGRGMDYVMLKALIKTIGSLLYVDRPLVVYEGRVAPVGQ